MRMSQRHLISLLGPQEWTLMEKCVERMAPVALATDAIQKDDANLYTVHEYVLLLCNRGLNFLCHRHVLKIKAHRSNQSDCSTFHVPALQALGPSIFFHGKK